MGFLYILNKVGAEFGFNITDLKQRTYLADKINEAAREIYRRQDIPFSLKECFVRVTNDYEMSLPPFIGELRAIRSGCQDWCTDKWQLHTMFPKYNKQEWVNLWKNWRIKGYSPIALEFDNIAPVTVKIDSDDSTYTDSDLTITFVGSADNSNNINESVTMTSNQMTLTRTIQEFKRIYKNKKTDYNITIFDADGNEISMIYADEQDARFMIVDVSKYPQNLLGCCTCADGSFIMEVLYKERLADMTLDSDSFPVDGYDDIIVIKTKQLLTEGEVGQETRAILMNTKAEQELSKINQDKQGTINKKLNWDNNQTFRENGYYKYPWTSPYYPNSGWPY